MEEICKICNTLQNLRTHLKTHNITSKEYYDQYLKKEHEGFCKICNKPTKFLGIHQGYRTWCSNKCHQNDPISTAERVEKFKLNNGNEKRIATWANKSIDEKQEIVKKSQNTMLKTYGVSSYSKTQLWKDNVPTKISNTNKLLAAQNKNYFHPDNYINPFTDSETIVKRKRELHNGNYFSDEYLEKIHQKPLLKTYAFANMIKFVPESLGNCLCHCNKCNSDYEINLKTLRARQLYNIELCTICNPLKKQYSNGEKELYNYIKSIYSGIIIENERSILNGKEIDIYLPDLKLGFEFDGTYWHADPRFYTANEIIKTKHCTAAEIWKKDYEKNLLAEKLNIKLIRIPEYDWLNNQDNVKNTIKNLI